MLIAIGNGQVEDKVVGTAEQKRIIWQGAKLVSIFGIGHLVAAGRGEKWATAEIQSLENTSDELSNPNYISNYYARYCACCARTHRLVWKLID